MPFSEEKIAIIEQALMTDEGRTALAQAFVNTIPNCTVIGNKLIRLDKVEKEETPDPIDSRFEILDL
jgi:hypothetical protein